MTVESLLDRCSRSGVSLSLNSDAGSIRYEAPDGIDPVLKADLKANKDELVSHLIGEAIKRCAAWLTQHIHGRYPRLADVEVAATAAGFLPAVVITALTGSEFVTYRSFPSRNVGEVERVRTADDWPDDPPLAGR